MTDSLKIYTVATYTHRHTVWLFQARLAAEAGVVVLDWTEDAPALSLPVSERRALLNAGTSCVVADQREAACVAADLMVYLGDSGKDTAVQVGMAKAVGTPVLGVPGPLETVGLMLLNAVSLWVDGPEDALDVIVQVARCRRHGEPERTCGSCPASRVCCLVH